MSDLTDALNELEAIWADRGMPIAARLTPGLSEAQVRDRCAAVGLTPPSEVIEWFGWHNSTHDENGDRQFDVSGPALTLYNVDEAIERWQMLEVVPDLDDWLPLVRDVGPQCISISMEGESPARLAAFDFIPEPEPIPHTLTEVVQYWSRQFTSGRWHWDGKDVIANGVDRAMYPGQFSEEDVNLEPPSPASGPSPDSVRGFSCVQGEQLP